jgi:hypothetical protein
MFQFGIGGLFANPNGGNLAVGSGPVQFGTIQEASLEMTQKLVSLMGQNKWPDDVAPSDMKGSGKSGTARINLELFNNLFFGDSIATGIEIIAENEPHSVPATTTFTITVNNVLAPIVDLGVVRASDFSPLDAVASSPATGQYSVVLSTGVYTFAAADASMPVLISYEYPDATHGRTLTAVNHIQGYGPKFEMFLLESYQGTNAIHLYSCRASKFSRPLKRDNYEIPDFEFEFYPNAAGKVLDFFQITP